MTTIYFKSKRSLIVYTILFCIIPTTFFALILWHNFNTHKNNLPIQDNSFCEETPKVEEDNSREEFIKTQYKLKKLIALTFDDGPGRYTENLVDELKKRNVKATFFILGENATSRQSSIKYIVDNGNEIGIHSYVHKLFTRITNEEIEEQIDKTKNVLYSATNQDISLIRVPYGSINDRVNLLLENNQLTNVLWDVDSKDWKFRNTNKIYNYTLKRVSGNDIILMHDIYKTSVEAALKLVDTLTSECYTFVTVSELLNLRQIDEK